ncbi:MAG: cytochrome P450 [Rhodobacteraceae bacterium]|nr:MAG: cytochrome P450 [Paracoccaceae bacterium]
MQTATSDAPFLPMDDPAFSLRDPKVAAARAESWYARTPYGLAVLRHEEMGELLLHPKLRQGSHAWPAHNKVTGVFSDWWARTILVQEGETHARLRKLVNPAFAGRLLEEMRPKFETMAAALVDRFHAQGACDFMHDFADPYASQILCLMLGIPQEEAPHVLRLSADMGLALGVSFKQHEDRINRATEGMFAYADDLVAKRRSLPGDDFMSALVAATEGDRLSDEELRDMILILVFAGIDTTRNQLGLGMSMFLDHPAQWALLAERPDLARKAVEEVMRVRPTITWVTREATEDFEYRGLAIARGTTVHLLSGAAGTDTTVFEPGFDITAERKRHYGFGGGVHHCLGHAIARSDMSVAMTVLPPRLRNPRLAGEPEWLPDSGNTGPVSLPIAFDPG